MILRQKYQAEYNTLIILCMCFYDLPTVVMLTVAAPLLTIHLSNDSHTFAGFH